MDNGTTLFLPGLIINSWQWVRNKHAAERVLCEQVTDPTVEPVNVTQVALANAWLGPSRGTTNIVSLRGALSSIEMAKKQLTIHSPHYAQATTFAHTLRTELRENVTGQLPEINRMVADAPCQLWVGLQQTYRGPLPVAAARLSRFVIAEPSDLPPALEPVLLDFNGAEGNRPANHEIAGLYVGASNTLSLPEDFGDLFQSAAE